MCCGPAHPGGLRIFPGPVSGRALVAALWEPPARLAGERGELPRELRDVVARVRGAATVPAAVGFGIGSAEQAAAVGTVADGVIIGSRLVREVAEASDLAEAAAAVNDFLTPTRAALNA
jgi:tryptophan synthase alpha subunit